MAGLGSAFAGWGGSFGNLDGQQQSKPWDDDQGYAQARSQGSHETWQQPGNQGSWTNKFGGGGVSLGAGIGSTKGFTATFGGGGKDLGRMIQENAHQMDMTRLGISPALAAEDGRNNRFAQAFGFLQNQANQPLAPYAPGNQPTISVGGVLNPQQISQMSNSANAGIDRTVATQNAQAQSQLAGRGFGSNSPLLAALSGTNVMQGMGNKVNSDREIRIGAAEKNAGQLLQSQQATEAQYANRQRELLSARGQDRQYQSALLQAISGMI